MTKNANHFAGEVHLQEPPDDIGARRYRAHRGRRVQVRRVDGSRANERHACRPALKLARVEAALGETIARSHPGDILQSEHAEEPREEELEPEVESRP